VLLNIFHLYRLAELDDHDGRTRTILVLRRERWWYKLAHVCQQWRNIILESPSRLDLHLLCTNGVPVADMLAHSPPLPLTIEYAGPPAYRGITAEDESGIFLALSYRDRVGHIYFWMLPNQEKFVTVMDDQFPILELLYIDSFTEVDLPVTFQAPNLRHLKLILAYIPIRSPLFTTAAGLVTLSLLSIPASFPPSYLLTQLLLLPQLENLFIGFRIALPNPDIERQPQQALDMITLPNLRWFAFDGASAYLEGLIARISAPFLNRLHVRLDHQPPFAFPQFIQTSENLRVTAIQVTFGGDALFLHAVPPSRKVPPLSLQIRCVHLDWQVATAVQLFGTLSPILSVVEQVTFRYQGRYQSHNHVDRSQWRELLRPFTNAKTIRVQDDLASGIFCSLPSDDGEPPLELLPNLEVVGGRIDEEGIILPDPRLGGSQDGLLLHSLRDVINEDQYALSMCGRCCLHWF
jgi:hypothetical protein